MKLSDARKYRAAIEKASGSLPDEELLEVPNLAPVWDAAGTYEAGDRVSYDGILYKCLQGHAAQEDWTPAAAVSLWVKVLIPEEDIILEWEQPGSTNGYSKGDQVTHNGKVWISLVDDNVWEPGVYGWEEVS